MTTLCRAPAVFAATCTILAAGYGQSAQLPTLEPTVVRAANEFISAMAKGDADTVRALLRQNVVSHPQLQPVLERMAPPLDRVIYRTADQLDPPDRENPIDNPPY
jgi:hypothetical protein